MQRGDKISEVFETLSEEDKNQCLIYMSALRDRQLISKESKEVVETAQ